MGKSLRPRGRSRDHCSLTWAVPSLTPQQQAEAQVTLFFCGVYRRLLPLCLAEQDAVYCNITSLMLYYVSFTLSTSPPGMRKGSILDAQLVLNSVPKGSDVAVLRHRPGEQTVL
jgi:hypothetical protein